MRRVFDQAYYERFYLNRETRATSPAAVLRQATFINAYLAYLGLPVKRILDVGCGIGTMLNTLTDLYPSARIDGLEYSEYLCETYGWTQGSVVNYRARTAYDLVICNDVIPYLSDRVCSRAIKNLADLCRGAMFLGALTREDYEICDTRRTDDIQYLRPTDWYRTRLARHFVNVGGGLYLKKPLGVTVWHLDRAT
ncbi:MAG: class I SAM-dependent methyltransferase [Proteobacteria bacterium]|nr:class I SAM-dependent methyltransferase [Pseudomonadota bacterium]